MSEASRNLPNIGWRGRIKQILILMGAILLGVIISIASHAQDSRKAKKGHFKAKYRTQINTAEQECAILIKKENTRHKAPLFAARYRKPKNRPQAEVVAHYRKPKYRPQAEVDAPRFAMVNQ